MQDNTKSLLLHLYIVLDESLVTNAALDWLCLTLYLSLNSHIELYCIQSTGNASSKTYSVHSRSVYKLNVLLISIDPFTCLITDSDIMVFY